MLFRKTSSEKRILHQNVLEADTRESIRKPAQVCNRNFCSFCFRRLLCLKASEEVVLLLDPRKHGLHELDRRKDRSLRPDVFDSTSLRLGEATSPGAGPTSNGAEWAGECTEPGDDLYQDVVEGRGARRRGEGEGGEAGGEGGEEGGAEDGLA